MNIYLMTDTGWTLFSCVDKDELIKRNISIGERASIGAGASIEEQSHCLVITNLGSRNAPMTAYIHWICREENLHKV